MYNDLSGHNEDQIEQNKHQRMCIDTDNYMADCCGFDITLSEISIGLLGKTSISGIWNFNAAHKLRITLTDEQANAINNLALCHGTGNYQLKHYSKKNKLKLLLSDEINSLIEILSLNHANCQ
jgi:hypothetical protein